MGTTPRYPQTPRRIGFDYPLLIALTLAVPISLLSAPVHAQEAGAPNLPGTEDDSGGGELSHTAQLEEQLKELNERLKQVEDQQTAKAASPLSLNGYVDLGFFVPRGNHGIGYFEDLGNRQFPIYKNQYSWTFLGDILSTAVNSRGEVADLGTPVGLRTPRFDSVHSGGAPGFIANEVNMRVGYALTERALLRSSVNFVPRTGSDFAMGDFIDVDVAEMEYVVTDSGNTSIFVGKTMPVFGIEYKERKSDQRFGITPSLIQRYTSGSQLGLKVRSKLLNEWLIVAASVTNNSSTTEQFHFYSEIDTNSGKTLNGRLALNVPIGDLIRRLGGQKLEIGVSGEWGAQDRAPDDSGKIWFAGVDLQYTGANFAVKAQAIRGHAPGTPNGDAWQLDLHNSGYVEVDAMVIAQLGLIVRAEMRDAFVALAQERAYLTKGIRYTTGVRVVLSPHIVVKAEYLFNREFGGISQFDNDVFTSSLVLSY